MTISALVCVTNPDKRQDPWKESINAMLSWASEVVVVCGREEDVDLIKGEFKQPNVKAHYMEWEDDYNWDAYPRHLNFGLQFCTGDWVIRMDIDYVTKEEWESKLAANLFGFEKSKAVTFQKFSTITWDKVYQKGPTILGINRRFKEVGFGKDINNYTDLCVPINITGFENGIPIGTKIEDKDVARSHLEFMNYDYCFKDEQVAIATFLRGSLAHKRFFGTTNWGEDLVRAKEVFIEMMQGRLHNKEKHIFYFDVDRHPIYIREKVKNLTEDRFGFNGWNLL